MFECKRGINTVYMNDMFIGKKFKYDLLDVSRLLQPIIKTKRYGHVNTLVAQSGIPFQPA